MCSSFCCRSVRAAAHFYRSRWRRKSSQRAPSWCNSQPIAAPYLGFLLLAAQSLSIAAIAQAAIAGCAAFVFRTARAETGTVVRWLSG
jgi:hypothetical protein